MNDWDDVAKNLSDDTAKNGTWHQVNDIDPVILNMLGNVQNKVVLDLACGTGHFSRLLNEQGAIITGVDSSDLMINKAKKLSAEKHSTIKYITGDAEELISLSSNSYEIVVSNMGIHNFKDAKKAISEVGRVLSEKGRFLFVILHPFVSRQPWGEIVVDDTVYYGKQIYRYMSHSEEIDTLSWADYSEITQYHRPLEYYISSLQKANFVINNLKEIITKKPLKYSKKSKGVNLRRSLYNSEEEKFQKENAKKEIPLFLFIEATKCKLG